MEKSSAANIFILFEKFRKFTEKITKSISDSKTTIPKNQISRVKLTQKSELAGTATLEDPLLFSHIPYVARWCEFIQHLENGYPKIT